MFLLTDKDSKTSITNLFKELIENIYTMNKQIGNTSLKTETMKKELEV
jgi:hypothetical protein